MSIGIVAGWALIALGVSYYFRTRIGVARWKKLHRWTALAWLAGIVHSLGEGTDAGTTWFLVCTAIAVVPGARPPRRPPPPVHPRPLPHMSPTLLARRARVARIRRTVVAATVAVFLALFATIYIQMAAGKDPALGTSATTAQVTTTSSDDTSSSSEDSTTSSDDSTTSRGLVGLGDDDRAVVSSGG